MNNMHEYLKRRRANARAIEKARASKEAQGKKRAEFWVPEDLTPAEKRIIQAWMPVIVEDARKASEE